jgi:hypothetical protein
VDAKFVAVVSEGGLRYKFEHVREEVTVAGELCALTNFVASNMVGCWQQI